MLNPKQIPAIPSVQAFGFATRGFFNDFAFRSKALCIGYLAVLMAYAVYYMGPSLFRAWYFSSDEYVYAAEVIRFLHLDFRQHFFDQPGTPFMLLSAAVWAFSYVVGRGLFLIPSSIGIEQFTFEHLPALFSLMRALTLVFFLISLVFLFRLASKLTNRAGGCAASLLLMMSPTYAAYSSFVRTESFSMFLVLAAILILLSSLEPANRQLSKLRAILVVGILAGLAAGARLHSITVSLPILFLLLWTAPSVDQADDRFVQRFCRSMLVSVFIVGIISLLFLQSSYFARASDGSSFHELKPLMLRCVRVLVAATTVAAIAYYIPKTRHLVTRLVNPSSLILLAGCAAGFVVGTPTVIRQYQYLIDSAARYSTYYRDYDHLGMPIIAHLIWFVRFYMRVIAPDNATIVLLVLGSVGILFSRDRKLLVVLAGAVLFFVSKPLDLLAAPHHAILWLPFYAIICSYPIAKGFEAADRRWPGASTWSSVGLFVLLALLSSALTSGPRAINAATKSQEQRMESIKEATNWMKEHTEPDAMIAIGYHCFNENVFYAWIQSLEVPVPRYVFDGRQYVIWWGNASTLKGHSGYACVTQSDRHGMKTIMDMMHPGEGTDPYGHPAFRMIQTFGSGDNEVDIVAFDLR